MHCGDIDSMGTAAGRVYAYLSERPGRWVDSWELTQAARVTALSTRISEIRHALRDKHRGERVERKQVGRRHYYRLVATQLGQQMVLAFLRDFELFCTDDHD